MTHQFIPLLCFISITCLFFTGPVFAIPNPASTYCVEQGYRLEIRTNSSSGGQFGVCIFSDGKECGEWEFFRGECGGEYKKETQEKDYTAHYILGVIGLIAVGSINFALFKRRRKK
ncbi:MAG: DUF333 domain-containing protein [Euryarchaeota archaeon]|nr:DUF333 domain-containing protein [Euryarchaeota archaeon]